MLSWLDQSDIGMYCSAFHFGNSWLIELGLWGPRHFTFHGSIPGLVIFAHAPQPGGDALTLLCWGVFRLRDSLNLALRKHINPCTGIISQHPGTLEEVVSCNPVGRNIGSAEGSDLSVSFLQGSEERLIDNSISKTTPSSTPGIVGLLLPRHQYLHRYLAHAPILNPRIIISASFTLASSRTLHGVPPMHEPLGRSAVAEAEQDTP